MHQFETEWLSDRIRQPMGNVHRPATCTANSSFIAILLASHNSHIIFFVLKYLRPGLFPNVHTAKRR